MERSPGLALSIRASGWVLLADILFGDEICEGEDEIWKGFHKMNEIVPFTETD